MFKKIFLPVLCLIILSSCVAKKSYTAKSSENAQRTKASQRPYTVYGQRYEPLKSHDRFVQAGIASWYGKDFHGRKTSSGETYDMHAMTAAHKTLPLGVYVNVRNTKNGKDAIVRINDRGPFVKGRVIDLSYTAAKKLGVNITGTAPVRIEALGFQGSGADNYKEPETYDTGSYTVQIGSFKEQENARRLSEEMKELSEFSEIHKTTVNGEIFYRVYTGKYTSLRAAEKAEKDFSENGYPGSFVIALEQE